MIYFKNDSIYFDSEREKIKMIKIIKKLLSICLCCIYWNGTSITAFAEKQNLTINDYLMQVQKVADEYDITVSVSDYDDSIPITQEVINRGIENLIEFAEGLSIEDGDKSTEISYARVMASNKNIYQSFSITDGKYGTAQMKLHLNVTVDLQNSAVIRVNSSETYQQGYFMNFESWTPTGITTTVNNPSVGYVHTIVTGRATFSYADPITSITTGYTTNVYKVFDIKCI